MTYGIKYVLVTSPDARGRAVLQLKSMGKGGITIEMNGDDAAMVAQILAGAIMEEENEGTVH